MLWFSPLVTKTKLLATSGAVLFLMATDNSGVGAAQQCNNVELFFRFPPSTFREHGYYRLDVASEGHASNLCEFNIGRIKDPRTQQLDHDMNCQRTGISTRLAERISDSPIEGLVFQGHPTQLTLTLTRDDQHLIFSALVAFPQNAWKPKAQCGHLTYMIEPKVTFLVQNDER